MMAVLLNLGVIVLLLFLTAPEDSFSHPGNDGTLESKAPLCKSQKNKRQHGFDHWFKHQNREIVLNIKEITVN